MLGEDRTKRALLGALIMDASPLLELRALNVRFGRVEVLRNFSLSVRRGEFVWLVGPTGSGKSTILRILAGLQQPASGEVVIAGDHVERFSAAQKRWLRRSMGLMMQDCFLLEDRTVESNVLLPALVANEGYAEARRRGFGPGVKPRCDKIDFTANDLPKAKILREFYCGKQQLI